MVQTFALRGRAFVGPRGPGGGDGEEPQRTAVFSTVPPGPHRVRCRGNSTTCWKVGRFCQSRCGWPTMPSGRRMIESCSGIVSPAACDSVESVHDATSALPLAFTSASYVVWRAWSTEAWHVTGPPSHSRLV